MQNPPTTTHSSGLTLEEKIAQNIWDRLEDFLRVYRLREAGLWTWSRNMQCKYVDLRIDMRDGGCIISAKGERISPEQLAWQYSKETPEPPK